MRLGIDFGTTRIVVAAVDRGNYPVVTFEGPDGEARDWFPPWCSLRGQRRYGFEAWTGTGTEEAGWTAVRSVKHLLAASGSIRAWTWAAGRADDDRHARAGRGPEGLAARALETAPRGDEPLEVMLGVPANAHSNQRFLTAEAFRAAGFQVLGLLNEPSAASIELGHCSRRRVTPTAPRDAGLRLRRRHLRRLARGPRRPGARGAGVRGIARARRRRLRRGPRRPGARRGGLADLERDGCRMPTCSACSSCAALTRRVAPPERPAHRHRSRRRPSGWPTVTVPVDGVLRALPAACRSDAGDHSTVARRTTPRRGPRPRPSTRCS